MTARAARARSSFPSLPFRLRTRGENETVGSQTVAVRGNSRSSRTSEYFGTRAPLAVKLRDRERERASNTTVNRRRLPAPDLCDARAPRIGEYLSHTRSLPVATAHRAFQNVIPNQPRKIPNGDPCLSDDCSDWSITRLR